MSAPHGVDGVDEDQVAGRHQHEEDAGGAGVQGCVEDQRRRTRVNTSLLLITTTTTNTALSVLHSGRLADAFIQRHLQQGKARQLYL